MDWELIKSQDDDNSYFKLVDFPVEILFYVISYLPTRDHGTVKKKIIPPKIFILG